MRTKKIPIETKPEETTGKTNTTPDETKNAAGEPQPYPENPEQPDINEIKNHIFRRILQIIDTCTDPKKLIDTYEAISKHQIQAQQTGQSEQPQQTIFETIARQME